MENNESIPLIRMIICSIPDVEDWKNCCTLIEMSKGVTKQRATLKVQVHCRRQEAACTKAKTGGCNMVCPNVRVLNYVGR
jgi:hypothetical protein